MWSKEFYIPGPKNVVAYALSRLPAIDEVLNKNILPKNVPKKYARMKDVDKECLLDVVLIAQAQQNQLLINMSDSKCKVCDDKK